MSSSYTDFWTILVTTSVSDVFQDPGDVRTVFRMLKDECTTPLTKFVGHKVSSTTLLIRSKLTVISLTVDPVCQ